MREDKFINENTEIWQHLEATLQRLKSKSIYRFSKEELDSFFNCYNLACGHLSYAKTNYGDCATTSYLNNLVASAHGYIYTSKGFTIKRLFAFLITGFPFLVKKQCKPILLATATFLVAAIISFVFTLISTDNAGAFLDRASVDNILSRDVNEYAADPNGVISSTFIFTNNIRVGILAFALGITLAIGSIYVLYANGYPVGVLAALYVHKGGSLQFWSLILPHGILELFAIFVCGGAGIIIGYSIINPKKYSRKDSFIINGKQAVKLVLGTIPIFIVAGIIEGFITPASAIPPVVKLIFAFFTLVLLAIYLILPNVLKKKALHLHH